MSSSSSSSDSASPPRRGLGAFEPTPSSHRGLDASPPSPSSSSSGSSASLADRSGLPSTFGGAKSRKRRRTTLQPSAPLPEQKRQEAGAWQKHTRGMAAKYMAKYGFTGRLGAKEDGIAKPVEAVQRPAKLGLGAGGDSIESGAARAREVDGAKEGKRWRKGGRKRPRVGLGVEVEVAEKAVKDVEVVEKDVEVGEGVALPEIVYEVRMLRDRAKVQLEEVRRRRGTEMLILDTALGEMRRTVEERDAAKEAVGRLRAVEDSLGGLQKAVDGCEEELEKAVEEVGKAVMEGGGVVPREKVGRVVVEVLSGVLERKWAECLSGGGGGWKRRRALARHLKEVLEGVRGVLGEESYVRLCTRVVLSRLRRVIGMGGWDAVKDAWVADVTAELSGVLPDGVVGVFAEEVLVPRLAARVGEDVGWHLWIHPWLPVVGRKGMGGVLGKVRVVLGRRLEEWEVGDGDGIIELVKIWAGVLSKSKLQMALARHVVGKLGVEVERVCGGDVGWGERPECFELVEKWSKVVSGRVLGKGLRGGFEGFCKWMRGFLFVEGRGFEEGGRVYRVWKDWIPGKVLPYVRGGLAAVLFVVHASRVARGDVRERLGGEGVEVLMRNRFAVVEKVGKRDLGRMGLKEVVVEVARREGLVVVGVEGGLKVGRVTVRVDGRRGVLIVGGRVVSVEEMVKMARG